MKLRNLKEQTENLPKSDQVVSLVVSIKKLRGRQFPRNPLGPHK